MDISLVITSVVIVCLIVLAITLAIRARRLAVQDQVPLDNQISKFQQMFEAGEISEAEFRKMKKIIATKAVQQAKRD